MQRDFGWSHIEVSLAFSVYALGFALGPLVLAPISEVYGRNPMYRWASVLFTCQSTPSLKRHSLTGTLQYSTYRLHSAAISL